MQKIIIKTALITVSVILFVFALVCGGILLFNSKLSAEFFSNIGKEETALHFYERGYERTPNEENLLLVLHSSIIAKDNAKLIEYFTVFDDQREGAKDSHEEFLAAKYCIALCENGDEDNALLFAEKYVGDYSEGCAPRAIIAHALSKGDSELLGKVLALLEKIGDEKAIEFSQKALNLINGDIQAIKNFLA